MSSHASRERLIQRAALLRALRAFFDERGFLEVETPLLCDQVIPEQHIEPFAVPASASEYSNAGDGRTLWLQASPELHMKRLVALGHHAVYQICKAFRRDERGRLHRPEFTMVEWYRAGDDMHAGMDLLDELCQSLLGAEPARRTTYAEAFQRTVGVDPHSASAAQLCDVARRLGVAAPEQTSDSAANGRDGDEVEDQRDEWLNLLLATRVEPQLGGDRPELLYEYPASQSALAVVRSAEPGPAVAERFELYWRGVELANGYHELTDVGELRRRLAEVNRRRMRRRRPALPLPESLLAAIAAGLPPCAGCALGFDRLAMLACGAASIDEVML